MTRILSNCSTSIVDLSWKAQSQDVFLGQCPSLDDCGAIENERHKELSGVSKIASASRRFRPFVKKNATNCEVSVWSRIRNSSKTSCCGRQEWTQPCTPGVEAVLIDKHTRRLEELDSPTTPNDRSIEGFLPIDRPGPADVHVTQQSFEALLH